jgi:integrase/recombinase XerC
MESPQTLTRDEVGKLLQELGQDKPCKHTQANRARDKALALFMLETGLRVGELVQLRISDVSFQTQPVKTLIVRPEIAKMHLERQIPVSGSLSKTIADLTAELWHPHCQDPTTFCFYRTDPTTHLTTRSVETIIRTAALAAIGRPIHPHMLRHTFASNLMRVASARIVQELLGHADLRSTQIYTHPNGDDLAAAIAAKDAQEGTTPK